MGIHLSEKESILLQSSQNWTDSYGKKRTSQTSLSPFDFEPASVRSDLNRQVVDVTNKTSAQLRASVFGSIALALVAAEFFFDIYQVFANFLAPILAKIGPLCLRGIGACLDLSAPRMAPAVRAVIVLTLRVLTFSMGFWSTFRIWDISREIRTTSNQFVRSLVQEALAVRTIYVGSGRFSISVGEEGLALHSNNQKYDADWYSFDFERFVKLNPGMPNLELSHYRGHEIMKIVDRIGLDDYAEASVDLIERWAADQKELRLFVVSNYGVLHQEAVKVLKLIEGEDVSTKVLESMKFLRNQFESEPNNQLPWRKFVVACYFGIALKGQG